ncbi:hypothetical protein DESC_910058 [Desulfosarcina cetonica]|nr:hypothetical protein DESC_910058 [Desulfosarcina cetonica]
MIIVSLLSLGPTAKVTGSGKCSLPNVHVDWPPGYAVGNYIEQAERIKRADFPFARFVNGSGANLTHFLD